MASFLTAKFDCKAKVKTNFKSQFFSPKTERLAVKAAQKIANRANSLYDAKGYKVKTKTGKRRVRAFVYTGDRHTLRSNIKHNTLDKAIKG